MKIRIISVPNSMGGPLAYGGELETTDTNDAQYALGGLPDWLYEARGRAIERSKEAEEYGKGGHWIQKAVNPKHKGYCTPMTKSTCTGRRRALALTFKKHHGFHEDGGELYPEGGDLPVLNTSFVPSKYVTPIDSSKLYTPSATSGIMLSSSKAVQRSILGDMLDEIDSRHNATENSKNKAYWKDVRAFLAKYPGTKSRGIDEVNYYKNSDARVKELLENTAMQGKLRRRGFEFDEGGNFIANNPELVNAGVQGVMQALKSRKINRLQPNTLDYTPISHLDESLYAAPVSGIAYRPIRNDEEIRGINSAYKGAEKAAAEYSDSGDYLNRLTAIGASKANTLGKTWENYYNEDANRRMAVDQYNKGIQGQNYSRLLEVAARNKAIDETNIRNKMLTQEYSNAEKDALTSLQLGNYGDWTSYLTGVSNDLAKKKAYNDMLTMEESKYPNYEFYRDSNGRLKSRVKAKATT